MSYHHGFCPLAPSIVGVGRAGAGAAAGGAVCASAASSHDCEDDGGGDGDADSQDGAYDDEIRGPALGGFAFAAGAQRSEEAGGAGAGGGDADAGGDGRNSAHLAEAGALADEGDGGSEAESYGTAPSTNREEQMEARHRKLVPRFPLEMDGKDVLSNLAGIARMKFNMTVKQVDVLLACMTTVVRHDNTRAFVAGHAVPSADTLLASFNAKLDKEVGHLNVDVAVSTVTASAVGTHTVADPFVDPRMAMRMLFRNPVVTRNLPMPDPAGAHIDPTLPQSLAEGAVVRSLVREAYKRASDDGYPAETPTHILYPVTPVITPDGALMKEKESILDVFMTVAQLPEAQRNDPSAFIPLTIQTTTPVPSARGGVRPQLSTKDSDTLLEFKNQRMERTIGAGMTELIGTLMELAIPPEHRPPWLGDKILVLAFTALLVMADFAQARADLCITGTGIPLFIAARDALDQHVRADATVVPGLQVRRQDDAVKAIRAAVAKPASATSIMKAAGFRRAVSWLFSFAKYVNTKDVPLGIFALPPDYMHIFSSGIAQLILEVFGDFLSRDLWREDGGPMTIPEMRGRVQTLDDCVSTQKAFNTGLRYERSFRSASAEWRLTANDTLMLIRRIVPHIRDVVPHDGQCRKVEAALASVLLVDSMLRIPAKTAEELRELRRALACMSATIRIAFGERITPRLKRPKMIMMASAVVAKVIEWFGPLCSFKMETPEHLHHHTKRAYDQSNSVERPRQMLYRLLRECATDIMARSIDPTFGTDAPPTGTARLIKPIGLVDKFLAGQPRWKAHMEAALVVYLEQGKEADLSPDAPHAQAAHDPGRLAWFEYAIMPRPWMKHAQRISVGSVVHMYDSERDVHNLARVCALFFDNEAEELCAFLHFYSATRSRLGGVDSRVAQVCELVSPDEHGKLAFHTAYFSELTHVVSFTPMIDTVAGGDGGLPSIAWFIDRSIARAAGFPMPPTLPGDPTDEYDPPAARVSGAAAAAARSRSDLSDVDSDGGDDDVEMASDAGGSYLASGVVDDDL